MNCKPHTCAICGKEKYHGAVCILRGQRGMRWICFECQTEIEKQDKERVSEDGSSKDK